MIEVELISIGIDWDWWMPVCVGYVVMYVWMFECMYESSNECVSEWMNECVNIWKNVWINEWDMNDEWMHCTHICTTPTYNIHLYVMYLLYWRLVLFVICIVCFFRAFISRINTLYPTWLFWCLCWLHAWCEPAKYIPNIPVQCRIVVCKVSFIQIPAKHLTETNPFVWGQQRPSCRVPTPMDFGTPAWHRNHW